MAAIVEVSAHISEHRAKYVGGLFSQVILNMGAAFRSREEAIMNLCRNALRTLGASLIIGLGFFSGALAQSGNPIRIGMKFLRYRRRGILGGCQHCIPAVILRKHLHSEWPRGESVQNRTHMKLFKMSYRSKRL